jgi:hypothetical protein
VWLRVYLVGLRRLLTDEDVVAIRESRHRADPLSHEELARKYGVALKTIKRICYGQTRTKAAGPIERPQIYTGSDHLFDQNLTVRCETCGGMVHPPCYLCNKIRAA